MQQTYIEISDIDVKNEESVCDSEDLKEAFHGVNSKMSTPQRRRHILDSRSSKMNQMSYLKPSVKISHTKIKNMGSSNERSSSRIFKLSPISFRAPKLEDYYLKDCASVSLNRSEMEGDKTNSFFQLFEPKQENKEPTPSRFSQAKKSGAQKSRSNWKLKAWLSVVILLVMVAAIICFK